MKTRDVRRLGIPGRRVHGASRSASSKDQATRPRHDGTCSANSPRGSADSPRRIVDHAVYGALAQPDRRAGQSARPASPPRRRRRPAGSSATGSRRARCSRWRTRAACPSRWRGALMPDAHLGYGLPIGGVLATDDAVIPYAVGVDIACRMKMTVLDLPGADARDGAAAS